jgi:hypothetical protein
MDGDFFVKEYAARRADGVLCDNKVTRYFW